MCNKNIAEGLSLNCDNPSFFITAAGFDTRINDLHLTTSTFPAL